MQKSEKKIELQKAAMNFTMKAGLPLILVLLVSSSLSSPYKEVLMGIALVYTLYHGYYFNSAMNEILDRYKNVKSN